MRLAAAVGDGEGAVDRDDSLDRLHEVGVDERSLRAGGVAVDAGDRRFESVRRLCKDRPEIPVVVLEPL